MLAGLSFYQIFWYFILYAVLGWMAEVAYHGVTLGQVVNRGFLNGPVCPIYGCGMVGVLMISNLAAEAAGQESVSRGLLFLVGMAFCTFAELLAGWALDRLFHTRWWDYTEMPLNFHGYICLAFSILWGLAVVLAVDLIHPLVAKYTAAALPPRYGWPLLAAIYVGLGADLWVTVATVLGMNQKLRELDQINSRLRGLSDSMSKVIGETSIKATVRVEESRVQAALAKAELKDAINAGREELAARKDNARQELEARKESVRQELEARRDALIAGSRRGVRRLMRAFPRMRHRSYADSFRDWRERISAYDRIKNSISRKK